MKGKGVTSIDSSKILLVFGPPGTGKTTHLQKRIERAAEKFGNDNILVASYTKTAARELASRKLPISKKKIGTLHAFCYRMLGKPMIAELNLKDWNDQAPPQYQIEAGDFKKEAMDQSSADTMSSLKSGASLLAEYNIMRASMKKLEDWPQGKKLEDFISHYESWKEDNFYTDFTDLIIRCTEHNAPTPDSAIGIFDEAQDLTPLQLSLISKWSQTMEFAMMAGDDDQCLYQFAGASADTLLKLNIPDNRKTILNQSYRVPQVLHEKATELIERIPDGSRQPKEYKPTEVIGGSYRLSATFKTPWLLIERIDESLQNDRSVMILASCGYMLKSTIVELKKRGYSFWNPYRPTNGSWNPIKFGRQKSSAKRLAEFLKITGSADHPWKTTDDVWLWVEHLNSKLLRRGAKRLLKEEKKNFDSLDEAIDYLKTRVFSASGWESFSQAGDLLSWFTGNLLDSRKIAYKYAERMAIVAPERLTEYPKIILGTIHSVKGGEADDVFLFPDISLNSRREAYSDKGRFNLYRQFYVAITRARQNLTICSPSTKWWLKI